MLGSRIVSSWEMAGARRIERENYRRRMMEKDVATLEGYYRAGVLNKDCAGIGTLFDECVKYGWADLAERFLNLMN